MPEGPEEAGIGELLSRLTDEAKAFGEAELAYYRALAAEKIEDARASLWMGAAGAGLMIAASVALVVGLVLTLSPWIGPGPATLLVVAVAGGTAWLLGRAAWRHIKRVLGLTK
jgi:hypothetical protein